MIHMRCKYYTFGRLVLTLEILFNNNLIHYVFNSQLNVSFIKFIMFILVNYTTRISFRNFYTNKLKRVDFMSRINLDDHH